MSIFSYTEKTLTANKELKIYKKAKVDLLEFGPTGVRNDTEIATLRNGHRIDVVDILSRQASDRDAYCAKLWPIRVRVTGFKEICEVDPKVFFANFLAAEVYGQSAGWPWHSLDCPFSLCNLQVQVRVDKFPRAPMRCSKACPSRVSFREMPQRICLNCSRVFESHDQPVRNLCSYNCARQFERHQTSVKKYPYTSLYLS